MKTSTKSRQELAAYRQIVNVLAVMPITGPFMTSEDTITLGNLLVKKTRKLA